VNATSDSGSWIAQRLTPQNWLDVSPDEEIPGAIVGWNRTFAHMFQVAFSPEIRRRIEVGAIQEDFFLKQAQLVQPIEGGNFVRLNDEIKGTAYIREDGEIESGGISNVEDLIRLAGFDLPDDEFDCGHFTILHTGKGWVASFDFRTGRGRALAYLETAKQFLGYAIQASEAKHHAPSIDNLFSCVALIAKAILTMAGHSAKGSKTHSSIQSAINRWRSSGNVDGAFVDIYNRLFDLRPRARYMADTSVPLPSDNDITIIREMLSRTTESTLRLKDRQGLYGPKVGNTGLG
jgi:uncharacterized protein (UPF0332 family)